jgi:catechol 2,3-dioxygenase-like lactoylglutathione lyase family enzyme
MTIKRISHVWFFVDELNAAEKLWCETLGFPVVGRDEEENITVQVGDVTVGLHLLYPGMESLPPSLRCNVTLEFTDDPKELVERLRAAAVSALDPMAENYGTVVQAFDPSGNALSFWQPPSSA